MVKKTFFTIKLQHTHSGKYKGEAIISPQDYGEKINKIMVRVGLRVDKMFRYTYNGKCRSKSRQEVKIL